MPDPPRTLRALAEAVVPGPPHDETLGAAEIEAERFIAHYLELVIPGLSEGVATMLDGLAAEAQPGAAFADLDLAQRASVLERLTQHEVADLRELGDLLLALAVASVYGEWSGQDEQGELFRTPLGWELTGWPGPVDGVRSLLRGP
jgi:hypothetical protein